MLTREKMTCVPEEPMSMPTLVSETLSCDPERIVLDRAVVVVEIVVIVVVVGIFVVLVREILTVNMVGECVAARLLVFLVGHSSFLLGRRH